MMSRRKTTTELTDSSWNVAGSFFGTIIAAMLIGLLADRWLNTEPWITIVMILVGAYAGFMRLYRYAESEGRREEQERIERRGY